MVEPRVARVTEIIAGSPKGFEEAVKVGFARATKTLRGITGLRVAEMRVAVENSKVIEYRVRLKSFSSSRRNKRMKGPAPYAGGRAFLSLRFLLQ
jgi:flavin-binding protein dodecin